MQLHLASETWLQVFDYATWIPGALTTSDPDALSAFFRDGDGICSSRRFSDAIQLKVSLSLVCKRWYHLAAQSLFQHIVVKSGRQAIAIAALLESKTLWDGDRGPGWYTSRLDIALGGTHHWGTKHNSAMARILGSCPNLAILSTALSSFDSYTFPHHAFVSALTRNSIPLRRLELRGSPSIINTIVSTFCSSVKVLWLATPLDAFYLPASVALYLPHLHYIHASSSASFSHLSQHWTLPSMKCLFVERGWETCLNTRGLRLRRVSALSNVSLPTLFHVCPSLESLSLSFDHLTMTSLDDVSPQPALRHIYIECGLERRLLASTGPRLSLHMAQYTLIRNLHTLVMRRVFPSLQCIRFYLPVLGASIRHRVRSCPSPTWAGLWECWIYACGVERIIVQSSRGIEEQTADIWMELQPDDLS